MAIYEIDKAKTCLARLASALKKDEGPKTLLNYLLNENKPEYSEFEKRLYHNLIKSPSLDAALVIIEIIVYTMQGEQMDPLALMGMVESNKWSPNYPEKEFLSFVNGFERELIKAQKNKAEQISEDQTPPRVIRAGYFKTFDHLGSNNNDPLGNDDTFYSATLMGLPAIKSEAKLPLYQYQSEPALTATKIQQELALPYQRKDLDEYALLAVLRSAETLEQIYTAVFGDDSPLGMQFKVAFDGKYGKGASSHINREIMGYMKEELKHVFRDLNASSKIIDESLEVIDDQLARHTAKRHKRG
jgi:hypothetical protein